MQRKLGSAQARAGSIVRGSFDLIELPTGHWDTVPTALACGKKDGPTLLVTANIHGGEVVGMLALHRFLDTLDVGQLRGTVAAVPSLNVSGLRLGTRQSQYQDCDPNRRWPSARPATAEEPDGDDWLSSHTAKEHAPGPLERAWSRLFAELCAVGPDFHVDLHSFTTNSIPFIFWDRVFYQDDKAEATALAERTGEMLHAIGFSVFAEASPKNLIRTEMYRTTSGAFLNHLRIPACTIELGATGEVNPDNRDAAVEGLFNLLRWAGMYPGEPRPLQGVPVVRPESRHRYLVYPFAPVTGILDTHVRPGERFRRGTLLARLRRTDGEVIHDVVSEFDGYLVGWCRGVAKYEGNPLAWVAVEDRLPMVAPWPQGSR